MTFADGDYVGVLKRDGWDYELVRGFFELGGGRRLMYAHETGRRRRPAVPAGRWEDAA